MHRGCHFPFDLGSMGHQESEEALPSLICLSRVVGSQWLIVIRGREEGKDGVCVCGCACVNACACMSACECECVHACVRACVRACLRAFGTVGA